MAYAMGGRTAEEIVFHDPTTGASNDIEKATSIARTMVIEYGFSDKLGAIKWGSDDDQTTVQIIQLLNKENNYGLIIIRISNVLGILLIALAFIQNPIHEMNRVKDKYWNYYSIYLVTVFIDLILEVLLRRRLYKKEEKL